MKAKHLLIFAAGISAALISCKKYDDGPRLSLRSKKSRVVNQWRYQHVTAPDGTDQTRYYVNNSIEFKKDGSYISSDGTYTTTGTWQFANDKEDIVLTQTGNSDAETWHILRLKSKELWVTEETGQGNAEAHLEPK